MNFLNFKIYNFRKCTLLIIFVFLITSLSEAAVKTKDGSESATKLSEYITEYSRAEIQVFKTTTGKFSRNTIPRILLTRHENPVLLFYTGTKLLHYDYKNSRILNTFLKPGMGIRWIMSGPAANKIYMRSKGQFSQFDLNSGKTDWTKDYIFHSVFHLYVGGQPRFYSFPILITDLTDKNQVMILGLLEKSSAFFKSSKYSNKMINIDLNTGDLISDREFHFRRILYGSDLLINRKSEVLSNPLEMFINAETWEFEILDTKTWGCKLKGKLNPLDLLHGKNYIAVDKRRLSHYIIDNGKEFSIHLLEKGFIITSRDCYAGLRGGIKSSKWVIFDEKGNKVKSIFPAPLTSVDLAVNNIGDTTWPVYMPNTYHRKGRRTRVKNIISLEKDGSYSEIELPTIEGIKQFLHLSVNNWFHRGETFYYTKDGNLYKFKIGDKTGELICKADKADDCTTVEAWDANYIMLRNWSTLSKQKNAILIRFSDGKKINPEEYNEKLDTLLWKYVQDFNQSGLPLPKTDVAPGFNRYMDYNYDRDFKGETKKSNKIKYKKYNLMFKIWGDYRKGGKYGDIGIVPATLNDKSTALIGINIADNTPLFSVPVLEFYRLPIDKYFAEFPEGSYLPFNIIRLNENEALLIVLGKIDLLKIYKIKRPF